MIVFVNKNSRSLCSKGEVITLSKKEFLLLIFFINNRRESEIMVESLVKSVWGARFKAISSSNISQLFYLLRRKLQCVDSSLVLTYSKNKGVHFFIRKRVFFIVCNDGLYSFIQKRRFMLRVFKSGLSHFIGN